MLDGRTLASRTKIRFYCAQNVWNRHSRSAILAWAFSIWIRYGHLKLVTHSLVESDDLISNPRRSTSIAVSYGSRFLFLCFDSDGRFQRRIALARGGVNAREFCVRGFSGIVRESE